MGFYGNFWGFSGFFCISFWKSNIFRSDLPLEFIIKSRNQVMSKFATTYTRHMGGKIYEKVMNKKIHLQIWIG